jgi:glycine cleavage system H protein
MTSAAPAVYPADLHYLIEHQVWARIATDEASAGAPTATVGISALGIRLAGEIYMCRPKSVGSLVQQGGGIAVVELAKAIVSVKSPLSGTVIEINPLLAAEPEWVHREPYGRGWLARLLLADVVADQAALLHEPAAVAQAMARHAALHRAD